MNATALPDSTVPLVLSVVSIILVLAVVEQRRRAGSLTALQVALALVVIAWFAYTIWLSLASP
jgi:hypothetical protein